MPKVLVTQPSVTGADDPRLEALHAAGWEIRYEPSGARMKPDELLELVQGHDAVIASSEPYTRTVLEGADTLKHVARWGVGFDQVDVPAATELGILVTTTGRRQRLGRGRSRLRADLLAGPPHRRERQDRRGPAPGPGRPAATSGARRSGSSGWGGSDEASRSGPPASR